MTLTLATVLISITVLNPLGRPIPGANILIDGSGCPANEESCVTDSAGRMVFDLEPGKRRVYVAKEGFRTFDGVIDLTAERPNLKLVLFQLVGSDKK